MNRKEVYEACTVVLHIGDNKSFAEHKLTPKMIDAIIDCAVEEAVMEIERRVEGAVKAMERWNE